jgi:hypothetical protein
MRILRRKTDKPEFPATIKCYECEAVLEVDEADVSWDWDGAHFRCPCCDYVQRPWPKWAQRRD